MAKVVTLGEIMLRLSSPGQKRFVQSEFFDVVYGGGEANVAVSCANYGHEAYFVSKLPKHEIGQCAVNALRRYGVHDPAWDDFAISCAKRIIEAAKEEDIPLEVNLGCIRWESVDKGSLQETPTYPYGPFWDLVAASGN